MPDLFILNIYILNYRSRIAALVLWAVLPMACNSSKNTAVKKLSGVWQSTPIAIDGSNKDWASPYPDYDEKAQLGYAVSNDENNLYITVETGDLATQLKILRNGLTVWIDKTGEKNQLTAINYPIPQNGEERMPETLEWAQGKYEDKQRIELEERVKNARFLATEYSLQGFKSCNLQYPVTEKDSCGIIVSMNIDADNEMVWEAVIPFKSFYFKPEIDKRDKGKPMSICIETVAMKRPVGQSSAPRPSNSGNIRPSVGFGIGGMGVGMNTGNLGRGGRTAPQNTINIMEPMYKGSITWKKFGIAVQ